jgi:hypothetical protein
MARLFLFLLAFFQFSSEASEPLKVAHPSDLFSIKRAKAWPHRVYLATYPRSGNHWMRYLIEEATGIATSSVYRDPDPMHLDQIFPWGGYCCAGGYEGHSRYPVEGEPVVVKTHFPVLPMQLFDNLPSDCVLRIVRHPVDSIYSWYVYRQLSYNRPVEHYIPRDTLLEGIHAWQLFQSYWDQQQKVITIYYEDMYQNPVDALSSALDAIGYAYTEADVKRAVAKHPPHGGLNKHVMHYQEEDLEFLRQELGELMLLHGYQ